MEEKMAAKNRHFDLFPKIINEQLNQSKNENDLLYTKCFSKYDEFYYI